MEQRTQAGLFLRIGLINVETRLLSGRYFAPGFITLHSTHTSARFHRSLQKQLLSTDSEAGQACGGYFLNGFETVTTFTSKGCDPSGLNSSLFCTETTPLEPVQLHPCQVWVMSSSLIFEACLGKRQGGGKNHSFSLCLLRFLSAAKAR